MSKINNTMVALIMIGGQSTRMGGGVKSLIKFNNKNIFDRILKSIKPQIQNIIINCNKEKLGLEKYKIPIIKDIKKGYLGPLAGIHAAMNWMKKNEPGIEWLVTLPGDTPFIPNDLISRFDYKISPNIKIILAKSNDKIHPIIGAWHISLFKDLDMQIDSGVRKILSWVELHPTDYVNYEFNNFDPFFNINSKEDVSIAEQIEKNFFIELS